MYYVESPYVRMRKEIAERKYVRMWNRRMYVCGKRLQKGSTLRVSSSALQQRRTDGRRYTRESWKGRRNEKGGKFVACLGQTIEAWRHSFSHKLGGNVLFPAIATSPDRTRYPWHVVANYALSAVIATSPDSRSKMFTFPW